MSFLHNNIIPCSVFISVLFVGNSWAQTLSLTLDNFIEIALNNNPEIEIAAEQFLGNEGILTQSRSLYFPRLSAGASAGRYNINDLQPVDEDNVVQGLLRAR